MTTVIDLQRNDRGELVNHKETRIEENTIAPQDAFKELCEVELVGGKKASLPLHEAVLTNPDSAEIFRRDVRYLAFSAYANNARTFESFVTMMNSTREQEEYLRAAGIGVIPNAPSGTPAPRATSSFEGGAIIKNDLKRYVAEITGDMIRYDQIGKIRQLADEMGRSARMTEENAVYSYITTTGNFTRNSTTNDNDIGANYGTTTFGPTGLDTALTTIATAKDRKSGAYLGYNADTFICGPRLMPGAKQFFLSNDLQRASANNTAEERGGGTYNPYQGMITKIVVSPWFGASFQWALCDSRVMSLVYQEVEPFNVYQQTAIPDNNAWLNLDVIEYLVRGTFGVGFVDDRAWYYSNSTTTYTPD